MRHPRPPRSPSRPRKLPACFTPPPAPNDILRHPPPDDVDLAKLREMLDGEESLIRTLALEDYWFFLTEVLWKVEAEEHFEEVFHRPIADRITAATPGTRDLLLAQRLSRKTMTRTVGHACWRICRDPNVRILVVSALDATAQDFIDVVRRQFQQNERLKRYFPHMHVPADGGKFGTQYEFTHPARTNINLVDPTIRSTYLGAPFAGRRCDILILDDPIDDKHVSTPDQADKALKWINALWPLVDKNPTYDMVFVQGTRKGFNDPYGAMMGESRGEEASEELAVAPFTYVVRSGLEDANGNPDINGEPTFPKVLNREVLMTELQRARMDPKCGEEWWWREYMNVCHSPQARKFLDEWFDSWVPVLPSNVVFSAIALDTALKDKQVLQRGDFTVAHVGHFDAYGHLYLTDAVRSDSLRSMEFLRQLAMLAQRAPHGGCFNILKQKVGEDPLFGFLEDYFHRMRMPCVTYPLTLAGEGKKVVRMLNALQGPFQARKVHFVGNGRDSGYPPDIWRVLRDEATHIGQWAHDDAIDALTCFFHKDVRIIPSARRSAPIRPMTHARLPQASTPRFNIAAVRARTGEVARALASDAAGDGTLRASDPFLDEALRARGVDSPLEGVARPLTIPIDNER